MSANDSEEPPPDHPAPRTTTWIEATLLGLLKLGIGVSTSRLPVPPEPGPVEKGREVRVIEKPEQEE
jgi:hypothetical protein